MARINKYTRVFALGAYESATLYSTPSYLWSDDLVEAVTDGEFTKMDEIKGPDVNEETMAYFGRRFFVFVHSDEGVEWIKKKRGWTDTEVESLVQDMEAKGIAQIGFDYLSDPEARALRNATANMLKEGLSPEGKMFIKLANEIASQMGNQPSSTK